MMKAQTRIILVICFAVMVLENFGTCVDISPMVDLDSGEQEVILSNMTFHTIMNLDKSASSSESVLHTAKLPTFNWHHRSDELVKSSEPRKRRIYTSQDDSASQPKVINNIQIVVNNNESMATANSCKNGICNVSVSSKLDGKGNIVTDVHLSIVTSLKPNIKVDDVPVIESFRGIDNDHYRRPILNSMTTPRLNPVHPILYHGNIPQIQTHHQGFIDPWQQRRQIFPQMDHRYFDDHRSVGLRGFKTRPQDKPIVDDKIEPPLSKTNSNNT